jgi:hypothetical protein
LLPAAAVPFSTGSVSSEVLPFTLPTRCQRHR